MFSESKYYHRYRYDYVELYDGKDASYPKLGRFCGNQVRNHL